MKPACWEACFLYPSPTVEHSNNCLLLLCRLFLEPSGHYTNLNIWKIKEPVQGTCNLNTTAWIETGSSVEWIVVNGLCFVHYVLIVKTDSAYDAELATGLPTPKFFIHECVNEWDMSSSKKCQLMVSGKRMTGTVKAGTYAGTICYAVA